MYSDARMPNPHQLETPAIATKLLFSLLAMVLSLLLAPQAAAQVPCPNPAGCPNTTATPANGKFTIEFVGVTCTTSGNSTWTYRVTWNGMAPALSHLTIGLCNSGPAPITSANLVSATIDGSSATAVIGTDGSTGVFGIKFDPPGTLVPNVPKTYSFTLNRVDLSVAPSSTRLKAGGDNNPVTICGPGCPVFPGTGCFAIADSRNGVLLDGDSEDRLVIINRTTGVTTNVGLTGTFNMECLTMQPETNELFGATQTGSGGRLGTLNQLTGAFTAKPQLMGTGTGALGAIAFNDPDGLSFDPTTGFLYCTIRRSGSGQKDILIRLDITTGAHVDNAFGAGVDYVVINGPGFQDDIDDITFNLAGQMLGITAVSPGGDALVLINKTTGTGTVIGLLGVNDMEGLTLGPNGMLFGSTGKDSSPSTNSNRMWIINPFTGAASVPVAFTPASSIGADFEGLACEVPQAPTAVEDVTFDAHYHGNSVTLQWRTNYEINNLGFHVYRELNGQMTRITPELIAGSALTVANGMALNNGFAYTWTDTFAGNPSAARYWIEDVSIEGYTKWHGPTAPEFSREDGHRLGKNPILLSQANRAASVTTSDGNNGGIVSPSAALPSNNQAQLAAQAAIAAQRPVKLFVNQAGFYRVTQSELLAAGFTPNLNPRNFQMFVDGVQIPIRVVGEENGKFDPSDVVEFYGVGLDTRYTGTRVYWLVPGTTAGLRVKASRDLQGTPTGQGFAYRTTIKEKKIYFAALLNGDDDNFFGSIITATPVEQVMTVHNPAVSGDGTLEVLLQGATPGAHQVAVSLNGNFLGTVDFSGIGKGFSKLPVPRSALQTGANTVSLIAVGGGSDVSLVEQLALTYQRTYNTSDDSLALSVNGGQRLSIGGFTSNTVRFFDVTTPDAFEELPVKVAKSGATFVATATATGFGGREILAISDKQYRRVAGIEADQPSTLRTPGNAADFIIIGGSDMVSALAALKAQRESEGLRVALVDVKDVYDEFSSGHKDINAIKNFISYARTNWASAPQYLLLVGDASFDPRGYLGMGLVDAVPTNLVDSALLEVSSDEPFGDDDNDGVAELAIGRLPVKNATETAALVQKIIRYAQNGSSGNPQTMLVADRPDSINYEEHSLLLKAKLPAGMPVSEVYRSQMSDAAAKAAILEGINGGSALINYSGHGSVDTWKANLLTNADTKGLTNTDALSFFVMMNCLNGYFHSVSDSLAESLLRSEGGAIAVWASSALTNPGAQSLMNQELYQQLFGGGSLRIGDAVLRAKEAVGAPDVRRSWIFFGDPTTRLRSAQ